MAAARAKAGGASQKRAREEGNVSSEEENQQLDLLGNVIEQGKEFAHFAADWKCSSCFPVGCGQGRATEQEQ
eukprot:9373861-Alexandrium_andersonii.AAC.1